MTLIVGLLCKEGVVVASDSAATFATGGMATIGQQRVQKVQKINEHILYASTGAIGLSQVISNMLREKWEAKFVHGIKSPDSAMDKIGKEICALVLPYLQTAQMQRALTGESGTSLCKSIVAMPVDHKPCLFQFDFNGAPERATPDLPFISLGSGQAIADPFLAFIRRLLWPAEMPTLAEGRLAAVWTIDHVLRTSPGGIGGDIQLATLEKSSGGSMPTVTVVSAATVQEHLQSASGAENAMINRIRGETETAVPAPPTIAS